MTEKIQQTLRDSKAARWFALGVVAFTMFAAYMFTDIVSSLKGMVEIQLGWDSKDFGTFTAAYGFFNVFFVMLVISGILLDKFGIRFSTITSAAIMVTGSAIQYFAMNTEFAAGSTIFNIPTQVIVASFGYALFGVGAEYAGITVSKVIVKWFKGKELATAMGLQVAFARLGSFAALAFAPFIAKKWGITAPVAITVLLLIIGFLAFLYYNTMDKKLDEQDASAREAAKDPSEEFKFSDLIDIIGNRAFWYIALLCVLFYSAVFPFYKYGPDLMVNKFGVDPEWSGLVPSLVPFGTILLTPYFGHIYDKKGKGATIMIIGAILLIIVHFILWLPFMTSVWVAAIDVIILGIAFSLVPSAMWPSLAKIIEEKKLGSAYALTFWIQNWGLMGIPFILGLVLNSTNPTIAPNKQLVKGAVEKAITASLSETNIKLPEKKVKILCNTVSSEGIDKVVMNGKAYTPVPVSQIDTVAFKNELEAKLKDVITQTLSENPNIKPEELFTVIPEKTSDIIFETVKKYKLNLVYDYSTTWLIFVGLTILALIFAILLKIEDKRKGYGLEEPNIEQEQSSTSEEQTT